MDIQKIAVLGSGNGGFMSAADFALQGYQVALYSRSEARIAGVRKRGGIEILDIDSRPTGEFAPVACATTDIQEALAGAQVILNPVPIFASEFYARLCAPHAREGQVFLSLGKGGASLIWARIFQEKGVTAKVFFGDTNTLPYGASRMGDYAVRLENRTQNLILAAFPGKDIDLVGAVAQGLYKKEHYRIRYGQNAMDSILVDYNAITHTPPMICNAALIESGDPSFHLFGKRENSPGVVRIIERIDRERMALGGALGLAQYPLEEEIRMVNWNPRGEDRVLPLYEAIHTPFLEVCEGPFTLETRHLTEDIPYGLVTYSSLGKMLGVPTPVSDAIITLSEVLLGRDFRSSGRTVETLGIDPGWNVDQLKNYLENGTIA